MAQGLHLVMGLISTAARPRLSLGQGAQAPLKAPLGSRL